MSNVFSKLLLAVLVFYVMMFVVIMTVSWTREEELHTTPKVMTRSARSRSTSNAIQRNKDLHRNNTANKSPQKVRKTRLPRRKLKLPVQESLDDYHKRILKTCAEQDSEWRKLNVTSSRLCSCGLPKTDLQVTHAPRLNVSHLMNLQWTEINSILNNLNPGGHWKPKSCQPRGHVAVIIPMRDRERHLRAFLLHTHPILQEQSVEYQIFVIEQNYPYKFNKGSLMNVGYVIAVNNSRFRPDCLIFHDVDLLLESKQNLFVCAEKPVHFAAYINKFNYTLQYGAMFGGAVALTPDQFFKTNGYSNIFQGWGGEDDDFYRRVIKRLKLSVLRPPRKISRYTMIKHRHDQGNPINPKSGKGFKSTRVSQDHGLNTALYKIISVSYLPTHTRVLVNLEEDTYFMGHYDVMPRSKCAEKPYRTEFVSIVTCENICTIDNFCRAFQYTNNTSGRDNQCQLLEQTCDRKLPSNSTSLHTRNDLVQAQHVLV